jgi:hypothetical protein
MKKSFGWLFVVCCSLFVVSACKYSEAYQTVNAKNEFTVSLPPWMKESDDLAPGAPFQYANRFRNFYTVGFVIRKDTAKADFDYYWKNSLNALKNSLTKPIVTDSLGIEVNGMKGVRAEVLGKMDGENIYFSEVVLDGKSKIYHLSVWVRSEERKLRFKEDINKIIGSVKEL